MIIGLLQKGPLSTAELLRRSYMARRGTTKQGVYAALRKLVRAEIALKTKREVALSATWLAQMDSFTSVAEHFYINEARSGSFLSLEDGERITYTFKSANATDAFWIHALLLLVETYRERPFLAYNPHCWFLLVRTTSERMLRDAIVSNGGQYLVVVGGNYPLDKSIRAEFSDVSSQYHMRETPLFPSNSYYVNVLHDYIIEVRIDPVQADAIERIYRETKMFTPDVEERLTEIINTRGKSSMVISRNRRRARELSAKLSKPFILKT